MKLILLLVAIYSLIFYQHYKIEKSRNMFPGSEPKAGKSYLEEGTVTHQDYGNAVFLIRSHYSLTPERQVAKLGFFE